MTHLLRLPLLLCLLLCGTVLEGAAKAPWLEVKSPNFVAYTDAGEVTARELLQRFEVMRELLRPAFPEAVTNPLQPVVLVIHRDRESMRGFIPSLFEKGDFFDLGGAIVTSPRHRFVLIPTDSGASPQRYNRVILHRYAHSLIHQSFADLPPWLEEGFASFYGLTEFKGDKVLVGQAPAGILLGLKARTSTQLPLDELLTTPWGDLSSWTYHQATSFQVLSWALLHYLWMDPEARKAGLFEAYLKALRGQGKDHQLRATESLGDPLKLRNTLNLYVRKPLHSYWTLPMPVSLSDKNLLVRGLGEEELRVLRDECVQAGADWKDPCPLPKLWK